MRLGRAGVCVVARAACGQGEYDLPMGGGPSAWRGAGLEEWDRCVGLKDVLVHEFAGGIQSQLLCASRCPHNTQRARETGGGGRGREKATRLPHPIVYIPGCGCTLFSQALPPMFFVSASQAVVRHLLSLPHLASPSGISGSGALRLCGTCGGAAIASPASG